MHRFVCYFSSWASSGQICFWLLLKSNVCVCVCMCMCVCVCVCVCVFSHVQLFATPWTIACQAFLSMEFSRQEYWSENQWAFNRCWLIKSLQKWTCWDSILRGGDYLIGNNVFNIRPPWAIKKKPTTTIPQQELLRWSSGWESAFQCRGCGFNPWSGN